MNTLDIENIFSKFPLTGRMIDYKPFGSGHINSTYIIKTDDGEQYILQFINSDVFPNIPQLMNNMVRVTQHVQAKINLEESDHFKTLSLIQTHESQFYAQDETGHYWRLMSFIPNTKTYDRVTTCKQAYESGKAFGHFQFCLDDLSGEPLFETIVGFHDLSSRLSQFGKAMEEDKLGRKQNIQQEILFIQGIQDEMLKLLPVEKLPMRVTHNDTKINNVLFNQNDEAICVIDLDTVMPGFIHYDYSDGVRTAANAGDEDERDFNKVYLDLDLFESFSRGFIEQVGPKLTCIEKSTLAIGAKFLPYSLAVRFLTDYLNGDCYFKVHYPDHNLIRTRAQLALVKSMIEKEAQMIEIVEKILRSI